MDIKFRVSQDSIDNARLDRDSMLNPPISDPGMDDMEWDDYDFGDSDTTSNVGTADVWGKGDAEEWGSGSDDPWATPSSGFGNPNMQGQGNGSGDEFEDKIFDFIGKSCKGFVSFIKDFVESFKDIDALCRVNTFRTCVFTGGGFAIGGILLALFNNPNGVSLLTGGLVTAGISVPLFSIEYENIMKNGGFEALSSHSCKDENIEDTQVGSYGEDKLYDNQYNDSFDEDAEDDDDFGFGSFYDDDDEEDDDFDVFGDDDFEPDVDFEQSSENENKLTIVDTMEGILSNINESNSIGIMTRQYLYDNITNCLMNINFNYDKVDVLHDGGDDFATWDAVVRNSSEVLKPNGKNEDMPYLIKAEDKLFYIQLEIKRVKWLKSVDAFVKEIVNICSYDENNRKNDNIYGLGDMVGDKIIVKIMKGQTAMVSLRDSYRNVKDHILNTDNYMPVVLGVDADGEVVWKDLKTMDSMLVTGMPRSGKSWFVQAMLTQMCMFLKPSELNFYILDPKGDISDFKNFTLPHVRKFVTTDIDILKELRHIVKVEGVRRKKIIGDAGCVNIFDFKKKVPDADLPLFICINR